METGKSRSFLFSLGGVIVVLVIAVAVNLIAGRLNWRVDATEDKVFTLSEGTKRILEGLESQVTVRYYVSRDNNSMPVILRAYGERVEDLLEEYEKLSNGKVDVQVLATRPDSDEADSAALDGVAAQQIDLTDTIYFGLSFTCVDQKTAIPFLSPDRESLLEYDLTRAISEVSTFERKKIGVMSSIEILGSAAPMMMNPAMAPPQQEPWVVMQELQNLFEVVELEFNGEPVPDDIDVLVIVHPSNLAPASEFQLDQFLLRGGDMIVFLDPRALAAQGQAPRNPMMPPTGGQSSTLPNLLPAWGYEFSSDIVADPVFRTIMSRPNQPPSPLAGVLSITSDGLNPDDLVTSQMDSLLMVFAGSFSGEPVEGIEAISLIFSTDQAALVDQMQAESELPSVPAAGEPLPLAIRLSGTFQTAFPGGAPEPDEQPVQPPDEDTPAETAEQEQADSLKQSVSPGTVIMVGDVDMLFDNFAVNIQNILGQRLIMPINANLDMLLNSVELLAGDSNLISIRSRGSVRRPFTVVSEMEAEAEAKFRDQIAELENQLQETQQRLSELQQLRPNEGQLLLTPEQEQEIRNFEERRVEVRNKLKDVRRELREDVEKMQAQIKWVNILGMPVVVIAIGIVVAVIRNKRQSEA